DRRPLLAQTTPGRGRGAFSLCNVTETLRVFAAGHLTPYSLAVPPLAWWFRPAPRTRFQGAPGPLFWSLGSLSRAPFRPGAARAQLIVRHQALILARIRPGLCGLPRSVRWLSVWP